MAFLDLILGLLLLWGLFRGLKNGLLVELASIIALIAGLYGAFHFSYLAADLLYKHWEWDEKYINLIAFLITFILIVIAVNLIGKVLTRIADVVMLGLLNKLAGAVFGTLKVAVILGAFLVFFDRVNTVFDFPGEDSKRKSVLYAPLRDIGAFVFGKVFREADLNEEEADSLYFTCITSTGNDWQA
jgi:membrane protein required for colicin V production